MNIYLVERPIADWESFDAFVIRAADEAEALEIAIKYQPSDPKEWIATAIPAEGSPEMILGSFVRG